MINCRTFATYKGQVSAIPDFFHSLGYRTAKGPQARTALTVPLSAFFGATQLDQRCGLSMMERIWLAREIGGQGAFMLQVVKIFAEQNRCEVCSV